MSKLNILITRWRAAGGLPWVSWMARTLGAAVWIKAYDRDRWLDLGEPFAEIAHRLQEDGVEVGAWGYHYGHPGEVDRLLECCYYYHGLEGYKGPQAGLLIDAEAEFERSGGQGKARRQVQRIIDAQLPVPVYYTSFAFPDVHSLFPYADFNRLSGGHVPQVYFNHHGWPSPADSVIRSCHQHHARNLRVAGVMLPVYDAGTEQGWRTGPQELEEAILGARMWNLPTIWTWSWEYHRWPDFLALRHYMDHVEGLT